MARKRRGPTPAKPWTPLHFSHVKGDARVFGNDRYTVTVREQNVPGFGVVLQLSVHTHTRGAIGAHDWRHFQRIKNELAGPEREAVEIYPPESQLVDTSNEFHLWVLPEGMVLPFGMRGDRMVRDRDDPPYSTDDDLRKAAEHLGITEPKEIERVLDNVKRRSKQRVIR